MVEIRKMEWRDLAEVTHLSGQLGYPSSLVEVQRRFEVILGNHDYALFVAVNPSGAVVGWIQINRETAALITDTKAEIQALVVDEKYRSQRVGAALVAKAEDWARAQGLLTVRVRSSLQREAAYGPLVACLA